MENQTKLQLPTEMVELPSKGLLYPESSLLSSGQVEMKYMTAREEDILTNQNYIKQGVVFDKLLKSLVVSKIDHDELLVGDKNAIMIAARVLGYGKDYEVKVQHPTTGEEEVVTVDLSEIKEKQLDETLFARGINEFSFTLPNSKNEIIFKIPNSKDEKIIDEELKSLKKINLGGEITTRLKHLILAINGDRDKKAIRDFVDNYLLASDARALREFMKRVSPDLDLTFTFVGSDGYTQEGVDIPLGVSFFYPSFRV